MVIILFSMGLYRSAFSTYFLVKIGFHFSVFWFFVLLYIWLLVFSFSVLCFEFKVISKHLFNLGIIIHVFFNFVLTLYNRSIKNKNLVIKNMIPEFWVYTEKYCLYRKNSFIYTHKWRRWDTLQNFCLAFIDELEKQHCWSGPIKNVRTLIFTMLHFFKKIKKNTWRYHYFTTVYQKSWWWSTVLEI